jgi:iron(III) transport system substrate-binding protein
MMKPSVRAMCGVASVMLCGGLASACSSSDSGSSHATLTLYSGQHEQTTEALVAGFTKATGIKVDIRSDNEAVLAQLISTEGGKSPADLFFTENSPPLMSLQGRGLLAPVDAAVLAAVPAKFDSPDGHWVGVSARVATLIYNTDALQPGNVPTSILDLADPKWKGKLGISPGETDFQSIVAAISTSQGADAALTWLKDVKANGSAHNYSDNEGLVAGVNKGQAQIGVINSYYWYRFVKESGADKVKSAVSYFAPGDVGYVVDVSGIGVLQSSKHKAEAERFVAFVVGPVGEAIVAASSSFEYPVGSGVAASPTVRPFAELKPNTLTIADLGDGSGALELLQKAGLL